VSAGAITILRYELIAETYIAPRANPAWAAAAPPFV